MYSMCYAALGCVNRYVRESKQQSKTTSEQFIQTIHLIFQFCVVTMFTQSETCYPGLLVRVYPEHLELPVRRSQWFSAGWLR